MQTSSSTTTTTTATAFTSHDGTSHTTAPSNTPTHAPHPTTRPPLEVEIVSEEEMAFIEAALASTRSLVASSRSPARFASCSSSVSCGGLSRLSASAGGVPLGSGGAEVPLVVDVEEWGGGWRTRGLTRPLRKRALSVTDFTRTEWCEKQMEFTLVHGKPEKTAAMKAGCHRHTELEEEIIQQVKISVESEEDRWAVKFLNFILGVNQLLFDGLTRELPVVGFLEGVWVIGIIDELRLHLAASRINPFLVDTKTRVKATLPSEGQKRNARLQLMCYKYLWDSNVTNSFYTDQFLEHFNLNPESLLSDAVKEYGAFLGFQLETFQDVFIRFREVSQALSPSEDLMILRYEFQTDNSLLGEYTFEFDDNWFKTQVQKCIQFLSGDREANYVADDERFKCNYCPFAGKCLGPSISKAEV